VDSPPHPSRIAARHDVETFGEFRTKRLVLDRYDAMTKATVSQEPYECPLDPPPADPRAAHPSRGESHHGQFRVLPSSSIPVLP